MGDGSSEARRKSSGLSARSYACSSPLELRIKAKLPAGCQRIMEIGFLKEEGKEGVRAPKSGRNEGKEERENKARGKGNRPNSYIHIVLPYMV